MIHDLTVMENKLNPFDARLKSALENLEVPYDASTWAMLDQRLPKAAPADSVDKAVFAALDGLEAPYQSSHWDLLANRMAEQARLRRRIRVSKLAEAAVFLLLLLNLEGLLGSGDSVKPAPAPATAPKSDVPIADRSGRKHRTDATHLPVGTTSNPSAGEQIAGSALYPSVSTFEKEGSSPTLSQLDIAFGTLSSATNNQQPTTSNQQPATSNQQPTTSNQQPATSNPFLAPLQTDWAALAAKPDEKHFGQLPLPVVSPRKAPKQSRFYVATFATLDHNRVKVNNITSQTTPGYGGGLAAGYRSEKWGVEAGLVYTHKTFQPRKEVEILSGDINKGYYGAFIQEVDADMVSVPVKVTRKIARMGKLTAHAVAGLTANVVTEKSYRSKSVFYPGFSPQTGNSNAPTLKSKTAKEGNGALEKGGSLDGNTYATANAGLRLEHPIGKRYSAFVEAGYHQAITKQGIGPKPSQISTLALQAGVMAGL